MLKHILKAAQKIIDKQYEKKGLNNDILEVQVRLNALTNKHNINFDKEYKQ